MLYLLMKKITIKHLAALLFMLMAAASASAQKKAYAVYTSNDNTLTFYYDNQMSSRPGSKYGLDYEFDTPQWYDYYCAIKKAVFTPSFADARPTRTSYWFAIPFDIDGEGSPLESPLEAIEGIEYLNTSAVTKMNSMFAGCKKLQELDVSHFNTANVTSMGNMFSGCSGLTSLNVTKFNTAKVTDMSAMFSGCSGLTSLNVTRFNTAKVTDMSAMFSGCSGLTSLNVTKFNTANVTNMSYMFHNCSGLTTLDVTKFDMGKVTGMSGMFGYCSGLTSLDLSGWETGNVTDMYGMFCCCKGLTSLDLSGWNTGNVTDMRRMFDNCQSLTTIYCGDEWNTDRVTDSSWMFSGCTCLVGGAGTAYNSSYTDEKYAHVDYGPTDPGYLTYKPHKSAYAGFNNGVLTFYYDMNKNQCPGTAYSLNYGSETPGWTTDHKYQITKVVFTPAFAEARPRSTHQWFEYQTNLQTIEGMGYLNTSKVTDMANMFYYCYGLSEISVGGFVTDKVTDMSNMFGYCWKVKNLDVSGWNTSAVKNMSRLFQGCEGITALNVKGWDTGNVTDMSYLFYDVGMESLDLGGWDTHNVTNMMGTFLYNFWLKHINLSGWNTAKVTNMNGMFQGIDEVEVLDLSSFNTKKVEDFDYMFAFCHKLRTIYCGEDWYVKSSATSESMFDECESLKGGEGTNYKQYWVSDGSFAHADGGTNNPGYLTLKSVPTGIDAPRLNDDGQMTDGEVQRFGVDGTRLSVQRRGLNIVRQADGTVKKVLVK